MIVIAVVVVILIIIIFFVIFKYPNSCGTKYRWLNLITFPELNQMLLPLSAAMTGGSKDEVLEKVQKDKLRENTNEYKKQIIQNIINGIEGYKKAKGINVSDSDIEFVGQGFQNVVVRMGKNGPLLRVAKFIKPFMFRQFHHTFNLLRKYNGKTGFLTPSFFKFDESEKQYIIWEVKELKPIIKFERAKIMECMKNALTFLNQPDVDLSYIDFKYENLMIDPSNNKYVIADFDLYKAYDVRNKFRKDGDIKAISINDLQEYNGQIINYCDNQEFVSNKVLLTYFDNENGTILLDSLDSKYDPTMLNPSLFARIFMLKVKQDEESNIPPKYDELITITDEVITEMANMKSTKVIDVLSFGDDK